MFSIHHVRAGSMGKVGRYVTSVGRKGLKDKRTQADITVQSETMQSFSGPMSESKSSALPGLLGVHSPSIQVRE